jgi:hypothetical protein
MDTRRKTFVFETKVRKKRGPKYGHEGKTRNGFEEIDNLIELTVESCPVCGTPVERLESINFGF